jgi:hypothetical protein
MLSLSLWQHTRGGDYWGKLEEIKALVEVSLEHVCQKRQLFSIFSEAGFTREE